MAIKKHIPNILSTIRLGMAFALPFVFLNTSLLNALIFYLVGDATDAIDGYLARKWKVQSKYGKLIDPIADKLLNGLTLLLASIFVNPLMFILTGFEALIAGTNLLRMKKKRDVNVVQIGRIKTVAMFFAIVSTLAAPMIPAISAVSNILIGLTAGLQAMTATKYLKEYRSENKTERATKIENEQQDFEEESKDEENEKLKQLKRLKELLSLLSLKKSRASNTVLQNNIILDENDQYNNEPQTENDFGISRTLKK